MITEEKLYKKFEYFKKKAETLFKKKKYNYAIDAAKVACELAKRYNLVFMDEQLEDFTVKLSNERYQKTTTTPIKDRIVFYDDIAVDNITLTMQYMRALISWDVEFMFLTTRNLNSARSKQILKELKEHPKAVIKMSEKKLSAVELMDFIHSNILEYNPEIALIHTQATDVSGVSVWHSFPNVKKYYVEMADHNFWLGTKMLDRCIAFRSFGHIVSKEKRNLTDDKILIQPYYPIVTSQPYGGLPFEAEGKIKILSGGRVSKIFDHDNTFLNLVKDILNQNPNTVFYFIGSTQGATSGPVGYIQNFIKKNNLEDRFITLGFRRDLPELMKKMDIYIGTYPIGGGLMTQIAAYCGLPIVQYATPGLSSSLDEFLPHNENLPPVTFLSDRDGFMGEVKKLVEDENWRKEKGKRQFDALLTQEDFNIQLKNLLETNQSIYSPKQYDLPTDHIKFKAIEAENLYMHQYYQILFKSKYYLRYHPLGYFTNLIKMFIYTDKKWFFKNMKKVVLLRLKRSWE